MTQAQLASFTEPGRTQFRHQWALHLGALAVLIGALSWLNFNLVAAAVAVWVVSPTYSHCFFIIPVSAFLIWQKRHTIAPLLPSALPSALVCALPFIAIQLAGFIASITEVQQIAFMGLVQVLILSVLGREIYTRLLFPLLFLFFLVPMGEYLVAPMQQFTTWFISVGLTLIGILHHTEGTIIEMVNGLFRVAEACAGLRFLIATIEIGCLFAYLNFRKWYKIVLFLLASAIVPIIANGFRALGIVLLAYYSDNKIATGADHLVYGWGFSVVILCLLMFIGVRFADPIPDDEPANAAPVRPAMASRALALTAMLGGLCIFAVPAFAYWNDHRTAAFDKTALLPPQPAEGWTVKPATGNWQPEFLSTDAQLAFGLQDTKTFAPQVDIAVDYYAKSSNGHGLVSSTNRLWADESWHVLSQGSVDVRMAGQSVRMNELILATPVRTVLVWWTYWANDRFTTSATRVKLGSLETVLGGVSGSALVAFSTSIDSDADSARARLNAALPSLSGLPGKLRLTAGLKDPG